MIAVPVLIAGGIGERFWPLSRSSMPKQLLPLISARPMLEETLHRIRPVCSKSAAPLIVTSKAIASKVKSVLPSRTALDMIVEPVGKNTAPAIACAAAYLRNKYGDAVMIVLPADHSISPQSEYLNSVKCAISWAQDHDKLVVFGITPLRPDTGYGYIETGNELGRKNEVAVHVVKRFVEKPNAETAASYVASGSYLWNSGMFVWKASVILGEVERYMPGLHRDVAALTKRGFSPASIDKFYKACEKQSIDYGIMEHSGNVVAVRGTFQWDDIGAWDAISRAFPHDAIGTTVVGDRVYSADTSGSIIVNKSALTIAAVGLQDVVLVATEDAILAMPKAMLPKIKEHLSAMKGSSAFPAKLF